MGEPGAVDLKDGVIIKDAGVAVEQSAARRLFVRLDDIDRRISEAHENPNLPIWQREREVNAILLNICFQDQDPHTWSSNQADEWRRNLTSASEAKIAGPAKLRAAEAVADTIVHFSEIAAKDAPQYGGKPEGMRVVYGGHDVTVGELNDFGPTIVSELLRDNYSPAAEKIRAKLP